MSSEAEAFVKASSPYKGATRFLHYMLAEVANAGYEYRLWLGDQAMAEAIGSDRRTVIRAKGQMVADGYLEDLGRTGERGFKEYRFLFPTGVTSHPPVTSDPPIADVTSHPADVTPRHIGTTYRTKRNQEVPADEAASDLKAQAHALTVFAFEQEIKPVLRGGFVAAQSMIASFLRGGHPPEVIKAAIADGNVVWTTAGLGVALANRSRARSPTRRRSGADAVMDELRDEWEAER